jgi:glycosyltransferase involved in cell wall biosynthesis
MQYVDALGESIGTYDIQPLFTDEYLEKLYLKKKISKLYILKRYFLRILWVLFKSWNYRFVYIEKELLPYTPAFLEFLIKGKYLVDYDDAIFHNYDKNKSSLIRSWLGNKIATVMKYAKVVVVGNEYLEGYAKRSGAREIIRIPTVISLKRYCVAEVVQKSKIVFGWIGTPNTQKYIESIFPVMEKVFNDNFKLVLIGANKDVLPKTTLDVEVVKWSESTEIDSLKKLDVGLMPLPDEPFEKGKCGYKLIQYIALGKPVIASPVGVNSKIVEVGKNGFLATSDLEWEKVFNWYLENRAKIPELGKNAREKFEKEYSLESQKNQFLDLFNAKI